MKQKFKNLLTWIVLGLLWLIIQLPYRAQLFIGKILGLSAFYFARYQRQIAHTNLVRCFPEITAKKREQLLRASFIEMGMGVIETAFGWWAPDWRLRELVTIEGLEHISHSLEDEKGALIFTAHGAGLHFAGRLMTLHSHFAAMFFPAKNPVLKIISWHAMQKHYKAAIARDDARGLIKALKNNLPVFYTPDTDAGIKNSLFVPFFNIQTATVTATARFAKITGCKVLQATYYRRKDNTGYVIRFHAPLENFPTDDLYADLWRVNQLLEEAIKAHPETYLWQYKRFKTRPTGEAKFYPKRKK